MSDFPASLASSDSADLRRSLRGRPLRLLVLAPFSPRRSATHGGARAVAEIARRLAERHRVRLLYTALSSEPEPDEALRLSCEQVHRVDLPWEGPLGPRLLGWARATCGMVQGKPRWLAGWDSERMRALVRATVRDWMPDVVQFEYHLMGQYVTSVARSSAARVLTEYEPGVASSMNRFGDSRERWERYERRLFARMSAVVALTTRDAELLAPLAGATPITTIPLGVDLDTKPLSSVGCEAAVVFVGNYRHPPNVDAVFHLARDIWPLVAERVPQAHLWLIGAEPTAQIRALDCETIRVVGPVDDVAPYLDRAAVVALPLRQGGGMRVKMLDALAAGKAIVASSLACEGIPLTSDVHAVVADRDDEFAAAIVSLLGDSDERRRLGTAARELSVAHLGWERTIEAYERMYATLLACGREGFAAARDSAALS